MGKATRSHRIETRFGDEALELVRLAADRQGRTVDEFVAEAAELAARRTIGQDGGAASEVLDFDESQLFVAILTQERTNAEPFRRALELHKRLIDAP